MKVMKERPMLFSGPMVRAILNGSKTQTRRIVKHDIPPHLTHIHRLTNTNGDEGTVITEHPDMRAGQLAASVWCPYGKPGDRIWVRETVSRFAIGTHVAYKADYSQSEAEGTKWRPSIHMPRWASRITLEVVSVRVERLNAISEEDAWAEGIEVRFCEAGKPCTCESNPVGEFADLWESINGPGSWDANPWVWVVEFKRIKP